MDTNKLHTFLQETDETAQFINDRANHLYKKIVILELGDTELDEMAKNYFSDHHCGHRLFFSIQSSAHIIYASVKKHGRKIEQSSFIDYGAGLGTLFLLAGLVGFRQVYYNDYFPKWAGYAKIICDKLDISMTGFISGDIDAVIDYARQHNITIDIIASRNVVEHIYSLRNFYSKLYLSGITSLCFATTTANFHNPAMRIKHHLFHRKIENTQFKKQREDHIKELQPGIDSADLSNLVKLTRGRAFEDFTDAIKLYCSNKPVPKVEFLRTNTCDCRTGQWAENLISKRNYLDIITTAGFKAEYTAGFWDTHYKYGFVNLITRLLNVLIKITGTKGYWFAPFVNITASKDQ